MTLPRIGLIGAQGKLGKAILEIANATPIFRETSRQNLKFDVLIDVSSKEALKENLSASLPIVIGTTGSIDFSLIEEASKRIPIFYASNFSLGASILKWLAKLTAAQFPADIDLIETHHKAKKDAPSGTALTLSKDLPNARIHSIRSGSAIGEHTIIFRAQDEKITLSHEAFSRSAFAKGAVMAAHFLVGKPPGLYGMEDLITHKDILCTQSS